MRVALTAYIYGMPRKSLAVIPEGKNCFIGCSEADVSVGVERWQGYCLKNLGQ
jgi:hypothetical protein